MSRFYTAEDVAEAIDEIEDNMPLEELLSESDAEVLGDLSDEMSSDGEADENEDEEEVESRTPRKLSSSRRLVCDIDSALVEENYEMLEPVTNHRMYTTALKRGSNNDNLEITWTTIPPTVGRQPKSAVVHGQPGVTGIAKQEDDWLKCWNLFFSVPMIDLIVNFTNQKIASTRANLFFNYYSYDTDYTEVLGFIGLTYLRGFWSMNLRDLNNVYDKMFGQPFFRATMSKERFRFLNARLSFDDPSTRQPRWKQDKFSAIRDLFEQFNQNCSKHLIPNDYLFLDETLYPMRTHIGFKQFNPSKPAKYELLFKSINSARYSYTFVSLPYCGKPENTEGSEYYVPGIENSVKYLINKLNSYVDLQGRNITFDRLYTSIPLAKWFLSHNITCIGTLQANRKGIPKEIKDTTGRAPFSYECYWEEDEKKIVLNSWTTKTKSSGLKNVLLLSTVSPLHGITKDDNKKKPAIYKVYDFTKGGTDIADQRVGLYTCRTKSRRWTMSAFSYILDMCRVNATTIYALNKNIDPKKIDSQDFIQSLVKQMISPLLRRRQMVGLHASIKNDITTVTQWLDDELNITENSTQPVLCLEPTTSTVEERKYPNKSQKRRRCCYCISEISGRPDYSNRIFQIPSSKNQCQECGQPTCAKHIFQICPICKNNFST